MPGCTEYREEMLLAALRRRLQTEQLSEDEKRQLRYRIKQLEEEMGLA